MLTTIYFHNQTRSKTEEVSHVGPKWNLTPELND